MPKAPPPSQVLTFQGRRDWPPEKNNDDWGLTPAQQETYVEQFRRLLASKNAWIEERDDYYRLRRFLRARSYDMEKAKIMWLNNLKWKGEFKVDTILTDFVFDERAHFLKAYPQGYHKVDKMGRPVYIQQLGQVNVEGIKKATTEERMIKFHIQEYERCCKVILPVCSNLAGRNIDQTFGIMDVSGVGLSHLTGEVRRLMSVITKYDQDNYPEMLGHICIINAPSIFRMVWSAVRHMLDPRTQSKIEILGTDYLPGVLKWVDKDCLPDWLGGTSHGSLLDDVGPWSDGELLQKLGMSLDDLRSGHRQPSRLITPSSSIRQHQPSLDLRRGSDMSDSYLSAPSSATDVGRVGKGTHLGAIPDTDDGAPEQSPSLSASKAPSMRRPSFEHNSIIGIKSALFSHGSHIAEHVPSKLHTPPRTGTLMERVNALEELISPYKVELQELMSRGDKKDGHGVNGVAAGVGASSSRSATPGSLLYRIETLEEALNVLLQAQEVALRQQQEVLTQQQAQLQEAQQAQRDAASKAGCCCIM